MGYVHIYIIYIPILTLLISTNAQQTYGGFPNNTRWFLPESHVVEVVRWRGVCKNMDILLATLGTKIRHMRKCKQQIGGRLESPNYLVVTCCDLSDVKHVVIVEDIKVEDVRCTRHSTGQSPQRWDDSTLAWHVTSEENRRAE